jgi:hypothetical protein
LIGSKEVTDLPIRDDRPESSRTEFLELPPGRAAAGAARAAVDALARDLGELYQDTRLLVSELVTAGVDSLDDAVPRVEMSISRDMLRVEVRFEQTGVTAPGLEHPALGQWSRMLLDALTSGWGTGDDGDLFLWFEMTRA